MQQNTHNPKSLLLTGAHTRPARILARRLSNRYQLWLLGEAPKPGVMPPGMIHSIARLDDVPPDTKLEGVISFAGERIESGRWTKTRRQALLDSRTREIDTLLRFMGKLETTPPVLVAESSTHFYGHRKDKRMFECGTRQNSFLSTYFAHGEEKANRARALGIRVVHLRVGKILSVSTEAPEKSAPSMFGVRAVFGDLTRWVPWIHEADWAALVELALGNSHVDGAINCCSAHPVQYQEFLAGLNQLDSVKRTLKMPAAFLSALLGRASCLSTAGQRALPGEALKHGFRFEHKYLPDALAAIQAERIVEHAPSLPTPESSLLASEVSPPKLPVKP